MDQHGDLANVLGPDAALFKADISDPYYHLRIRRCDRKRLAIQVEGVVYLPLRLNCGLAVALWFVTKDMQPVVALLRARGHRVFAYLDDLFGAACSSSWQGESTGDKEPLKEEIQELSRRMGLLLHPRKCHFSRIKHLEILFIVIDTEIARFLLSAAKLSKIKFHVHRLLRYATQYRRHVRVTDIRRFPGLGNSVTPAVVDDRLWLRELFDSFNLCHVTEQGLLHGGGSMRLSHAAMLYLK